MCVAPITHGLPITGCMRIDIEYGLWRHCRLLFMRIPPQNQNARQREKLFILIPSHDTLCYFGTRHWCLMLARISTVDNEWDFGGNFAWACELKQVRLGCRAWRIHQKNHVDRLSARAITKHALLSGTPQAWPQGWIGTLNLGQKALARWLKSKWRDRRMCKKSWYTLTGGPHCIESCWLLCWVSLFGWYSV